MRTYIQWADGKTSWVSKSGGWWYYRTPGCLNSFRTLALLREHAQVRGGRIVRTKSAPKATAPKASTKSGVVRPGDRGYPVGLAGLLAPRR